VLYPLAPNGSTGNITGAAVGIGSSYNTLAFLFVVEVAGGAPTVTYKFQGTMDGINWFDLGYITDASDSLSQATRVRTAVGADICFVANPVARQYAAYRVIVTGNNNITFRAEAYTLR
jgi:hypothetical protein